MAERIILYIRYIKGWLVDAITLGMPIFLTMALEVSKYVMLGGMIFGSLSKTLGLDQAKNIALIGKITAVIMSRATLDGQQVVSKRGIVEIRA